MLRTVLEAFRPVLAFGEEPLLTRSEIITIGVVAGVVALAVFIALLVRMRRRGPTPQLESCQQCGSMNVQNRAGLAVCMDCGYSVRTQEAEA